MTLTKANIVEAVTEQNGYPKNQSFEIIETLLEIMKSTLESGEDVLVSGLVSFTSGTKTHGRAVIQLPARMQFCRHAVW